MSNDAELRQCRTDIQLILQNAGFIFPHDRKRLIRILDDLDEYLPAGTVPQGIISCHLTLWKATICHRLALISNQIQGLDALRRRFPHYGIPHVFFGQLKVNHQFSHGTTAHHATFADFLKTGTPCVNGRNVVDVGRVINDRLESDKIKVKVFNHRGMWIAVNNRGFAAHAVGGVKPLRLIPCTASTAEENRLDEVEGVGGIGTFGYPAGLAARLTNTPHRVPSDEVPICTGTSFTVEAVGRALR